MRCFHSNQLDKDRVWTFGSGPRMCVGHKFIHRILKVFFKSCKLLDKAIKMTKNLEVVCHLENNDMPPSFRFVALFVFLQ